MGECKHHDTYLLNPITSPFVTYPSFHYLVITPLPFCLSPFHIRIYVRTYVKRDVRRIMLAPMLVPMLESILRDMLRGMLRDMLELMLEPMLGGMLEGGQSPILPPTTSHFLFVLGLLLLLLLFPYPTVTTSTSTVSVLAFTPLPFGRPTFKVPAARFSFNSLIRC